MRSTFIRLVEAYVHYFRVLCIGRSCIVDLTKFLIRPPRFIVLIILESCCFWGRLLPLLLAQHDIMSFFGHPVVFLRSHQNA